MKEKDQELVSIIVPVYNVYPYLAQCLDSLCAQSWRQMEIILIDDGSTDGSENICDRYAEADSRIRVIHKKNQGVSAARNDGIEQAGGRYLMFVDADDRIHPELVAVCLQAAEPGVTVICGATTKEEAWEACSAADWEQHVEYLEEAQFMQAYRDDYINPPFNKLYAADVIRKYGIRFPEDVSLGEDLWFNLSYQEKFRGAWKIIHEPLYYYREYRNGSLSNLYRRDLFEIQQMKAEILYHFMQNIGIWNEESKKVYYGMYWDRLFLIARICREYERTHPEDRRLGLILSHPIWKRVWKECRIRKLLNWKRRIKGICVMLYKMTA